MKKLTILLSFLICVVFGMRAVDDVQLIAYSGGIFDSGYGATTDEYRYISLTNSNTSDGWYVVFDKPIQVGAGEEFCFAHWPEGDWARNGLSYPESNNQGFNGVNNGNMKFSKACSLNAVRFYWTGNDAAYWAVEVYVDDAFYTPAGGVSAQSEFGIDVWAMPQFSTTEQPWDVAGGLFAPFNTAGHYTAANNYVSGQTFPLASRFKGQHKANPDKKFLKFCGPLTDQEMERYGDHARHWASTDYREGTKFAREAETELYVIDFCEGNEDDPLHARGLYVRVPDVDDMNLHEYDPDSKENIGAPAFYRMGVRFGFIDQSYAEEENNGYNDHLRFVKWGHCFRLNEISRPVNAFPVLDAAGSRVVGFTDDFGPCEWNGENAGQTTNANGKPGTDDFTTDNTRATNAMRNKKGDSRILAERNFWLKRIFLEVAYADAEKKIKRFYIYFDGEYDLNGGSRSFAQDFFVPAKGNYVGQTPNIFHGSNLAAEEAGFNRFHNLDLKQCQALIGIDGPDYVSRTGKGRYLYDLELTAPYRVESTYAALDANGDNMRYLNGDPVQRTVKYEGRGGEFWGLRPDISDEAYINGLNHHTDAGHHAVIDALETALIFDPSIPAQVPTTAKTRSVYTFPNQAFPTIVEDEYPFDPAHIDNDVEIPLTVEAVSRNVGYTDFTSHVDWSAFQSMTRGAAAPLQVAEGILPVAADDIFPVANYVVKVAGSESPERPADEDFQVVEVTDAAGKTLLDDANSYWASNDLKTIGNHRLYVDQAPAAHEYYVHYLVEAYYNICYPVSGILKKARLYNDAAMTEPSELLAAPAGVLAQEREVTTPLAAHADLDEVTYRVQPKKVMGHGYALFNDQTTTAIDTVGADSDMAPRYFDLQGIEVSTPVAGRVYIVRRGDTVAKELAR